MELLFWLSSAILFQIHVGYPASLLLFESAAQFFGTLRFLGGEERRRRAARGRMPVTLLIPLGKEAPRLEAKLENSLCLDYPEGAFEILVGGDGADRAAEALAASCPDPRVRLSSAQPQGSLLDRCIPEASGEIVVVSGVGAMLERRTLDALVRRFDDPAVAAVCGRVRRYRRTRGGSGGDERARWNREAFLAHYEGLRGVVLETAGAPFALRRSLFEPLPEAEEDERRFGALMAMRLSARGFKVAYEPDALAYEEMDERGAEGAGEREIVAPWLAGLSGAPRLLAPCRGFISYALLTNRLPMLASPLLFVITLLSSLWLSASPLYFTLLALQLFGVGLAIAAPGLGGSRIPGLARVAALSKMLFEQNRLVVRLYGRLYGRLFPESAERRGARRQERGAGSGAGSPAAL